MKKLIILSFALLSLNSFSQSKNLDWHVDMNKAIELSEKTNRPIMMFFTGSDWCGWCIKLVKEVFDKPEFAKWSKKVILVELDFPKKTKLSKKISNQNRELAQLFQVGGYPTIWFVKPIIDNEGKVTFEKIGRSGYVRGVNSWINESNRILTNK